jgi:hypothetical protein
MSDSEPPTLTPKERLAQLRRTQRRMKEISSVWTGWLHFEKTVLADPKYEQEIKKAHSRISQFRNLRILELQTISGENVSENKDKIKVDYPWPDALRNVMTDEWYLEISRRFNKTAREFVTDLCKYSSHWSWLKRIARMGEYGLLAEVTRGFAEAAAKKDLTFVEPHSSVPVMLTAAEIKQATEKANAEFQRIEKEFTCDNLRIPITETMAFVRDVDRQISLREPNGPPRKGRKPHWKKR